MFLLTLIVLCICNNIIATTSVEYLEVQTTLGKVRGKLVDDDVTGALYYSFKGIPYAEPPVQNLRFKPPVRKRMWYHVFDATNPGYVCPQREGIHSRKEMSEDCLNFNIYRPANYFNKLLPVMFVIHGGEFEYLSGNAEPVYGPQLLILNDIVVVTLNYRLGALGFLALCTEEISGNAGLKDVLLGLKIVKENIKMFGGDPNKITLMGNGAGAAMVEFLMLTNQSVGLFQSVIIHGGSVLSAKHIQLYPRRNAMLLGRELGVDLTNDDCMVRDLRHVNAFEIVKAQHAISLKEPQRIRNIKLFKPTVEIDHGNAIITQPPLKLLREGAISDVPIVIGFNNREGAETFRLLKEEPEIIDRLNENPELLIPADIKYPYGSVARRNLVSKIRDFYFNGKNISYFNIPNYIDFKSDSEYIYPTDLFVKMFTEKKKSSVYYHIFASDTKLNCYKAYANITYPGAAHFDDTSYVFLTSLTKPRYQYLSPTTKRILHSVLLNMKYFLYYGRPAPNPSLNCWPKVGKERYHIYEDYSSIAVYHNPLPKQMEFWNTVYEEYFSCTSCTATYFCTNDSVDQFNN